LKLDRSVGVRYLNLDLASHSTEKKD